MSNFSDNDPKQDGLKDAFENIRADSESSEELFFDPATGELRSARSDDDSDRVPATQMAREGFFLREGDGALAEHPLRSEPPANGAPSSVAEREELVIDNETGDLQTAHRAEASDRVPATRMAQEGFFAGE